MALDYSTLKQLWLTAGGKTDVADTMAAIALAESSGNAAARNPVTDARGLWQVNMSAWKNDAYIRKLNLFQPADNAKAAVYIFNKQGLSAWSTYTSRSYEKYLEGRNEEQTTAENAGILPDIENPVNSLGSVITQTFTMVAYPIGVSLLAMVFFIAGITLLKTGYGIGPTLTQIIGGNANRKLPGR